MRRLAAAMLIALLAVAVIVLMLMARATREMAGAAIAVSPGAGERAAEEPSSGNAAEMSRRLRTMQQATDEHGRQIEEALEEAP